MIRFAKAEACGNDFLVCPADVVADEHRFEVTRLLCARNRGIGADGVEYFDWSGPAEGRIQLRNADGSIAEISGNGTRCVAAWMARERGLKAGAIIRIETDAGWRECRVIAIEDDSRFEIESKMGMPTLRDGAVLLAGGERVEGTTVNTGNPHFVIHVDTPDYRISNGDWEAAGREICFHSDFPMQTNVEFFRVLEPHRIEIRIFERGVGPTSSSGTGTCACAVTAISRYGCSTPLQVEAPGGTQIVHWDGRGEIRLTGPASIVAEGQAFVSTMVAK